MASPHEWQQIEELFHATLAIDPQERAAYLDRECGDATLRREVESLIAASEHQEVFMETPALSLGLRVMADASNQVLVGQVIGHYKILKPIGSGGMGDVYLAEDCTLERQVALKFLSRGLVDDTWANAQFMREAKAIAQLENPNICAIHGLEQIGDHSFIIMQYVEGETLDSLLTAGPLEVDQALNFAEQIASALAAAHLRGIIHRDIKTQNIIVTPEGQIKVLDFGLAKFIKPEHGIDSAGAPLYQTQLGVVVGTVAYMSPEQTRGEELDCRSDIFGLGIVMQEMITGRNPFLRLTHEQTMAAIREYEPSPLPPSTPEFLVTIVRRCLDKKREHRFQSTEDLLDALSAGHGKPLLSATEYLKTLPSRKHFTRYAIAAAVFLAFMLMTGVFVFSKVSRVHTLAIVPISNQSTDPKYDYLSAGLTRNLFDKFSYLPRFKVKLPTVVGGNQTEEIVRIGRELKVEAVLVGEIQKQGQSLSLRVRVINTADGTSSLDQLFSVDPNNIFVLQDEVANRVTSALGVWFVGNEKLLLTRRQTNNQEALNAYMYGRHYWSLKRNRTNIQTAIEFFDRAIELDPAFAKAYSGRADCHVLLSNVLYGPISTKDAMDKARFDARKAIEIDPTLPEAHTSLGSVRFKYDWRWQDAEEEFRQAIKLDPEYAPTHYEYANLLSLLKRSDEAIKEAEIARDLDPHSPLAGMNYGRTLYYARRYDDAFLHFQSSLQRKPDYPQFVYLMSLVLLQQQQYKGAIELLEKLHEIDPLFADAPLGYAYAKSGRVADAERILAELDKFSERMAVTPQEKAIVYIGLGKRDEAFDLLEQAYQQRFANLIYLTTDPLFDDLRSDKRFGDLALRMNLLL
jgi:eukaryotic-like serine/threonine-protein kinase